MAYLHRRQLSDIPLEPARSAHTVLEKGDMVPVVDREQVADGHGSLVSRAGCVADGSAETGSCGGPPRYPLDRAAGIGD